MQTKNSPPPLGRWRKFPAFFTSLVLCLSAFTIQVKAEMGGLLYFGGSNALDKDGYANVLWNPKDPKGAYGLSMISSQPHALWLGDWTGRDKSAAANYVYGALTANQVPVLVLYNIPFRDCGQASDGGAKDSLAYHMWVSEVAAGIEDGIKAADKVSRGKLNPKVPIMVMLEPDSIGLVPTADYKDPTNGKKCWVNKGGPKGPLIPMFDTNQRFNELYDAVWTLASTSTGYACNQFSDGAGGFYRPASCTSFNSRVKVYLDGGNAGWQATWPEAMAKRMVQAGIGMAQGFFTNASNYQWTANELGYGYNLQNIIMKLVSSETYVCGSEFCKPPQKTQVIDVSRNGNGPGRALLTADGSPYQRNGWPYWCDNTQAHIGQHPTLYANKYVAELSPSVPELKNKGPVTYVDGLLWLKPPGETDGCWGGPSTTPNTQPAPSTILTDLSFNGSWIAAEYPAGWASPSLACGLTSYTFLHPAYTKESTAFCDIDPSAKPEAPANFRITNETRKQNGAAEDTVTLEWDPVPGACEYQLTATKFPADKFPPTAIPVQTVVYANGSPIVSQNKTVAWKGFGPRTDYVVNPAIKGLSVSYQIRAVSCDGKKFSALVEGSKSTTYSWK